MRIRVAHFARQLSGGFEVLIERYRLDGELYVVSRSRNGPGLPMNAEDVRSKAFGIRSRVQQFKSEL
jgi:hypothetical protein